MREMTTQWMQEAGDRLALMQRELMDQIPVDRKLLRRMERMLDSQRTRQMLLLGVGAGVTLALLGRACRRQMFRCAVAREVRRQLEPVNEKLDELQTQCERILAQQGAEAPAEPETALECTEAPAEPECAEASAEAECAEAPAAPEAEAAPESAE